MYIFSLRVKELPSFLLVKDPLSSHILQSNMQKLIMLSLFVKSETRVKPSLLSKSEGYDYPNLLDVDAIRKAA
jgi:hypothetical protein